MYNLLNALCNQIIVIVENISYSNLQKAHEVIREELSTSSTFANIIGKSQRIQEIFSIIDKIKDTPTTILLEGESGTGKELVARAVHFNSNRRNKKFVAQYCGALPETLLESELFGHVKGSFTGATHDKKGLFEIANGGTFFLDEIADISLSTQAKLLRFLQEGEIKRVGSTKTENVDVRVICATNVSLKDKVESGEFRLDLYYRLNVIKIEVPSLRERKSDIPLLAVHFLDKYCNKINKKINGITDEAMKYLSSYDWPGNIRQLENEIERAVTLAEEDSYIKSSDLSEEIFRFQENTETINLLEKKNLKDAVEQLERQMIIKTLDAHNWNQTKTAKELGLSRQGLIKKIQRYKLEK
jgi:transcriptional regulator with PAS, ATPase and Fis domain